MRPRIQPTGPGKSPCPVETGGYSSSPSEAVEQQQCIKCVRPVRGPDTQFGVARSEGFGQAPAVIDPREGYQRDRDVLHFVADGKVLEVDGDQPRSSHDGVVDCEIAMEKMGRYRRFIPDGIDGPLGSVLCLKIETRMTCQCLEDWLPRYDTRSAIGTTSPSGRSQLVVCLCSRANSRPEFAACSRVTLGPTVLPGTQVSTAQSVGPGIPSRETG